MKRLPSPLLALLVGGAPLPAPAAPPAQSPVAVADEDFPSDVGLVVVDAVVLDEDGEPVAGLTPEDFTIAEEGRPQTIQAFQAVRAAGTADPAGQPPPTPIGPRVEQRISTNQAESSRPVRSFVVVFDDAHLTRETAGYARTAVARFLREGAREGDLVTLVATVGGVWQSGRIPEARDELLATLERLEARHSAEPLRERISDFEALRIHVHRDPVIAARVERRMMARGILDAEAAEGQLEFEEEYDPTSYVDPYVSGRAAEAYRQAAIRNRLTLEAVQRALEAQALTRGRKSLILVSEGFVYDTELDELDDVTRAARRANTAIYFVDARGLQGLPAVVGAETERTGDPRGAFSDIVDIGHRVFQMAEEAAGSETLASESGGFTIKNTNDLGSGLQRIADESRTYYLLGYIPADARMDGKFREIEVEVRKGLTVRARKGYYAPREGEPPEGPGWEADAGVQRALDAPYAIAHVPLRMSSHVLDQAAPEKARVLVAVDVEVGALEFEERDGRFVDTVEYLLTVMPRGEGEPLRYDEKADLRLLPATRERLERTGYRIIRDFELAAGPYRAKIVVRDQASGRLGSVSHDFEVPALSDWRVSTPVLSETFDAEADPETRLRVQPSARRVYRQGERLYCEFQVYGTTEDPESGQPRVAAGHALQDGLGRAVFAVQPTTIRPSTSGAVSRIVGLETGRLPPGDYALQLFVEDRVSGDIVEILEPFRLVPGEGPDPSEGAR